MLLFLLFALGTLHLPSPCSYAVKTLKLSSWGSSLSNHISCSWSLRTEFGLLSEPFWRNIIQISNSHPQGMACKLFYSVGLLDWLFFVVCVCVLRSLVTVSHGTSEDLNPRFWLALLLRSGRNFDSSWNKTKSVSDLFSAAQSGPDEADEISPAEGSTWFTNCLICSNDQSYFIF